MLKNQLFGVEVEMTGITREKAAKVVATILGTTPSRPNVTCYETRTITNQAARKWKVMRDSSIVPIRNDGSSDPLDQYRVEFVTPPLNYDDIERYERTVLNPTAVVVSTFMLMEQTIIPNLFGG